MGLSCAFYSHQGEQKRRRGLLISMSSEGGDDAGEALDVPTSFNDWLWMKLLR